MWVIIRLYSEFKSPAMVGSVLKFCGGLCKPIFVSSFAEAKQLQEFDEA